MHLCALNKETYFTYETKTYFLHTFEKNTTYIDVIDESRAWHWHESTKLNNKLAYIFQIDVRDHMLKLNSLTTFKQYKHYIPVSCNFQFSLSFDAHTILYYLGT